MEVELPDGTILYDVPEGTTKAQLQAKLRGRHGTERMEAPPIQGGVDPAEGMNWAEKLAVGAGAAVDRAGRGITSLIRDPMPDAWFPKGKPTDAQGAEDAALYQKHHPGGWATAGEIAGDIGMSAVPVSSAARGANAMSRLLRAKGATKTAAAVPVVADIAANAGYAAATAPENRGSAALWGGGGAAGGRVLNRTLSGVVKPTAAAQELLDRGVRMTPGQAGEGYMGAMARTYEDALGAVPVVGRGVQGARAQGLEDWNRAMFADAAPSARAGVQDFGSMPITRGASTGQEGVAALKGQYDTAYGELFPKGGVLQLSPEGSGVLADEITELMKGLPPSLQGKFDELANGIASRLKEGVPAPLWKETITGDIEAARQAAYRNGDNSLVRALGALDKKLMGHMDEGRIAGAPNVHELTAVDKGYGQFKVLKKAGERAAALKRGGTLYPSEVAVDAAKGKNPALYQKALAAQQMFGSPPGDMAKLVNMAKAGAIGAVGHTVAGGAALPPVLISLLGTTEAGRRFLLGQAKLKVPFTQTAVQQFLRAHPQIASQLGRATATQGTQR